MQSLTNCEFCELPCNSGFIYDDDGSCSICCFECFEIKNPLAGVTFVDFIPRTEDSFKQDLSKVKEVYMCYCRFYKLDSASSFKLLFDCIEARDLTPFMESDAYKGAREITDKYGVTPQMELDD